MKLLVVTHACVTPINQSFYADVAKITGWDIELVIPSSWNSEYESNLQVTRWKEFDGAIHTIPVWKAGNIPLHLYKTTMMDLLRNVRPDVIYVHHEPYGLATAQVYLANKMVDGCPIGFYGAQNIFKKYPIPFRWFEQQVLRNSNFCFPVTEGALGVARDKGYTGIAEVLPLPVDTSVYHPKSSWAAAKRAELGIGTDEFVIGYLGRLVEEKGLNTLLHAAKMLNRREWRCILVGNGPYEPTLRATVAALNLQDHILFPGFVPHEDAPGWLSLFDVLVLPSETRGNWKEQFGRVIVEANACETAVIGTESGEIGNVLRATGGGLIVPEANVAELGTAILKLADNPEKVRQLGVQGAAAVREKYDQAYLASRFATTIRNAFEQEG